MTFTFKQFLNERRVQNVQIPAAGRSRDELYEKIYEECSDAINYYKKSGMRIYRGDALDGYPIAFVDPASGGARRSANTDNYYTLIIDNSDAWHDYPPRSRSLICSSSKHTASEYGENLYMVVPVNGSKVAQCQANDFWGAFDDQEYVIMGLGNLNLGLELLLQRFNSAKKFDRSYDQLIDAIESVDEVYETSGLEGLEAEIAKNKFAIDSEFLRLVFEGEKKYGSLLNALEQYLDPKANKIDLFTTKNLNLEDDREVWTNGKSYLIELDHIDQAFSAWAKL